VKDPESGRWLVRREELERFIAERQPPTVVLGYDLTCSAPKSVSLLWAFGDEQLRADIAVALNAGVEATIGYLERYGTVGTVGGRNRPGLGLAAASYRHDVSRAAEAHLHVHNVIVNAVAVPLADADGRPLFDEHGQQRIEWRALDGEVLMAHVKTAGYLGAAAMRHELSRRRGLVWGPIRNGVAELAGFPAELLEAFSTRTGEVEAEFAELVAAGHEPGGATRAAAQQASRAPKKVIADDEVRAIQARRLAETGWTRQQVRDLGARRVRVPVPPTPADVVALYDRLAGRYGLTEHRPTFGLREVHQVVAEWAGDRLDAEGVAVLAERFLADSRLVLLTTAGRRRRSRPEFTYTTVDLLQMETELLRLCRRGSLHNQVPVDLVEEAIDAVSAGLRRNGGGRAGGLTAEQACVIRAILTDGRLVRPAVGPAGSGKTEAMRAVVEAFTAAGCTVIGATHGGRQAEELRDRLGVPTRVVSGWLTLLDNTDPARAWRLGTVLIVDEATQVSTRDARRLFTRAAATGTVVIAVGDPAQLGAVGAGGWFAHLVNTSANVPALADNQRQRGPELAEVRAALAELRSPNPAHARRALDRLASGGRLCVCDDRDQLLAAVVADWRTDRLAGHTTARMMAERHADAELLNRAARARLHADGRLSGPALRAVGREFQVGDEVITLTQEGHTLVPSRRPRTAYVRTGSIGTVAAVHVEQKALTVHFAGKGDVRIGWAYLNHAFPDGRDGGLAHAYALTAHKAEGATLPTARALAVDDTSRAGMYVMLSRARHDIRACVIARADLEQHPDDETWLPVLRDPAGPLDRLGDRLEDSQPERLATEHDPVAYAAHQLRAAHSLAELHALHRPPSQRIIDPAVLARAEAAAEAAATTTALTDPPDRLVARIGPRPASGPHREVWEAAVAALAVYHARHRPPAPPSEPGPEPAPPPEDDRSRRSREQRAAAERIAADWAASLSAPEADRFRTAGQALPRARAVAGIHALLDHSHDPETLSAKLRRGEQAIVRVGAAVLDHRVRQLLDRHRIDPNPLRGPAPRSQFDEWERVHALLEAADAQLTGRPAPRRSDPCRCPTSPNSLPSCDYDIGLLPKRPIPFTHLGDSAYRDERGAAMTQMTEAELRSLPPTIDLPTAARALGCGRTLAYTLARRGRFPCRVLRLGQRYLVPTADLLHLLGLTTPDQTIEHDAAAARPTQSNPDERSSQ
jgi:conjugative relaxase-like TrwC/TraI family protein